MNSHPESNNRNNQPRNFLVVYAMRLLIIELVKRYRRKFDENDFETVESLDGIIDDPRRFVENEKSIYLAFKYRFKYLIVIRFDKNELGQPVLLMTPTTNNDDKQIEIIELDAPRDNTPKFSIVSPEFEC